MPYTRITATKNAAAALQYARGGKDGKGHNQNEFRNEIVTGVNLMPEEVESYEAQMNRALRRASSRNKNQARRIIQSFSRNEANPDNPEDVMTVHNIGVEFARKAYPGRQAVVFTQTDGKSGLLHNHIIVCNVSIQDAVVPVPNGNGGFDDVPVPAGRGCIDEQTRFSYVKRHTNEIAIEYLTLDFGQKPKDKLSQAERTRREGGKYVWKDDLRERIETVMSQATSLDDFLATLPAHGVTGIKKHTKGNGDFILYQLTDTSHFGPDDKIPDNLKSKSYKLGEGYGLDAVLAAAAENTKAAQAQQQSEPEEAPPPAYVPAPAGAAPDAAKAAPAQEDDFDFPDFIDWAASQGYEYSIDLLIEKNSEYQAAKKEAREAARAAKESVERVMNAEPGQWGQGQVTADEEEQRRKAAAEKKAAMEQQIKAEQEEHRHNQEQNPAVLAALEAASQAMQKQRDRDAGDEEYS